MVQVTWPRWLPCPYMVKTLKKSSSPEPKGLWPWNLVYVCRTGARVLPSMFKWWPSVAHDLLYGKVRFGPLCFCLRKGKTMDISETIVIHWPWTKVTQIQHFQTCFSEKLLGWLKPNFANWSQISCGSSMGWGNESLFKWSRSHGQDGHYAHIW